MKSIANFAVEVFAYFVFMYFMVMLACLISKEDTEIFNDKMKFINWICLVTSLALTILNHL